MCEFPNFYHTISETSVVNAYLMNHNLNPCTIQLDIVIKLKLKLFTLLTDIKYGRRFKLVSRWIRREGGADTQ